MKNTNNLDSLIGEKTTKLSVIRWRNMFVRELRDFVMRLNAKDMREVRDLDLKLEKMSKKV